MSIAQDLPLIILGIDFINNIDWYEKQLSLDKASLSGIRSLSQSFFGAFRLGYEILIYNGILTFLGLLIISKKS